MKTLHLYLLRQVVASMLMTAAVFTFVLLLGNVLRSVFTLLVGGQVSLGIVFQAVLLLIPYVWAFALPMAMLTATLLVFGRFSAEHELTAARAGGISLVSLAAPVLLLSLVLCGVCAIVNLEVAPRCWNSFRNLTSRLKSELSDVRLPEGRYITDFKDCIIFVARNRNNELTDVRVLISGTNGTTTTFRASRGKVSKDEAHQKLVLELFDVKTVMMIGGREIPGAATTLPLTFDLNSPVSKVRKPKVREMTFSQLRAELRNLEQRVAQPALIHSAGGQEPEAERRELERQLEDLTSPIRAQIHEQVASSFACFGFALVGIPLAIRVHRRETNIGFALALLLVAVYYSFLLLGEGLSTRPEFAPHLIMWLPNFIFQAVGVVLLWRANRGI